MRYIELSVRSQRLNHGLYVSKIDDCDFDWAAQFSWSVDVHMRHGNELMYVFRQTRDGFTRQSKKTKHYLHREIAYRAYGELAGFSIDHRDGDGLNNTRDNLRLVTRSQNSANSRIRTNSVSGFKGVCWHPKTQKWRARIGVGSRGIHLGLFRTPEEAAIAYDVAAINAYGQHARLNFPVTAA